MRKKKFLRSFSFRASLTGSNESILRVDFSAETSQVLGAGNDNAVRIWGTDTHVVKACHFYLN